VAHTIAIYLGYLSFSSSLCKSESFGPQTIARIVGRHSFGSLGIAVVSCDLLDGGDQFIWHSCGPIRDGADGYAAGTFGLPGLAMIGIRSPARTAGVGLVG
jgi:hypothetical protein